MLYAAKARSKKKATTFYVDEKVFEQTKEILKTRATPIGITLKIGPLSDLDLSDPELFGILIQYPNSDGEIINYESLVNAAKEGHVSTAFSTDLLSLTLLKPPGEMGAECMLFIMAQRV